MGEVCLHRVFRASYGNQLEVDLIAILGGRHCYVGAWQRLRPNESEEHDEMMTSARVAQEVCEPLIGIQYLLCSRLGDTANGHHIHPGRSFHCLWPTLHPVAPCLAQNRCKKGAQEQPTVKVYWHLEDESARAGRALKAFLALTTTREAAQNLRNYFEIAWKTANAETAVKVAGATAQHCIVMHGESTFLSGEGRNLDYDQE